MMNQWIRKPKAKSPHSPRGLRAQGFGSRTAACSLGPVAWKGGLVGVSLLVLLLLIACGAAATATPAPPAPKAPAAAAPAATVAPAATATPFPKPTITGKPLLNRLVVAFSPADLDTNVPWFNSRRSTWVKSTALETLLHVDQKTGDYLPGLATKWEVSPDGKTWTFTLRKGVQFHDGWGEVTAKDVVHSAWAYTQEVSLSPDVPQWRALVGRDAEVAQNVQIIDDYQVAFRLKSLDPDLYYLVSRKTDLLIMSKAFWDKEGLEGYQKKVIGTGPYKFKERRLGEFTLSERVENHWRHTPEFKEIQFFSPPEDGTRLAMLLAGEAHIVDIPTTLHKEAQAKGMKTVSSTLPGQGYFWMMGGLYFATPEKLDPKVPFTDKRVREAMNRAINRKDIIDNLLGARGLIYPVHGFLFGEPGWNPKWEEEFDKRYGYDPVRARALLKEAGYPNGFSFKMYVYPWPGLPENIDVSEALAQYYKAIGLNPELVNLEFARVRQILNKKEMHGALWSIAAWAPSFAWYRFYNLSKEGIIFSYEHPAIDQLHAQLRQTLDPKERARLLQAIGDHKFEEYAEIPIVRLFVLAAINPKVVAEYTFPGTIAGFYTHLEYVKAVK